MNNRRNYYRILHVQKDAPEEIIRTSYRTLMQRMRMHPDLGGNHQDASLINEAYATLIDPQLRAEYDLTLPHPTISRDEPPGGDINVRQPTFYSPPSATVAPKAEENESRCCMFCRTPHGFVDAIPPSAHCGNCDSPLYPAVQHRFDQHDKRAIRRTPRHLRITCTIAGYASVERLIALSEDISLNGMRLIIERDIPDGSRIKIECSLLNAVAEVRNCQRANKDARRRWQIGVEFLTIEFTRNRGAFVTETA